MPEDGDAVGRDLGVHLDKGRARGRGGAQGGDRVFPVRRRWSGGGAVSVVTRPEWERVLAQAAVAADGDGGGWGGAVERGDAD